MILHAVDRANGGRNSAPPEGSSIRREVVRDTCSQLFLGAKTCRSRPGFSVFVIYSTRALQITVLPIHVHACTKQISSQHFLVCEENPTHTQLVRPVRHENVTRELPVLAFAWKPPEYIELDMPHVKNEQIIFENEARHQNSAFPDLKS